MPSVTALRGMLRTDALRMLRDHFLIGLSAYVLFVFVLMRGGIPWLTREIATHWKFDLTPYHPLLVSHFAVQLAPWIPGMVGGFLLLESREEGTVKALLVAPNSLSSYLSVVCAVMFVAGVLLTLVASVVIGLALPPWPALIALGFAAGPAGPALALLISAVADNKVQALAYLKILGLGPVFATGAYFVPEPWQWLAASYPPYCASKAYWVARAGGSAWPVWVFAGLVMSAIWLGVLWRLFQNAARK